ncbi:MAG: response regulator [Candidatus Dadabacteria bacterium]|nr:MAG: response regulator [Candidatus Dadabacteria bacterium]
MTHKATVLLVDDVQSIVDEEARILGQLPGLRILKSLTGASGLQMIVSERPDLVFLDLMLPDLSGEQICRVVKSKPELEQTAIVIVTGRDDQEHLQRAFQAGCDAYVVKPFDPDDLVEKVRIILAEKGIVFEDEPTED